MCAYITDEVRTKFLFNTQFVILDQKIIGDGEEALAYKSLRGRTDGTGEVFGSLDRFDFL